MNYFQSLILIFLFIVAVNAESAGIITKEIILDGKQNKTICLSGDTSVFKLWSYRLITISPNWGDVEIKINSPDSNFFQYLVSLIDTRVISVFNDPKWYDVYSRKDLPTQVYISPYGKTCISINNPYSKNEYPMKILIKLEQKVYLLYPTLFVFACMLFIYSRLLCTTASFYYIFFIITSPFLSIFYLLSFLFTSIIHNKIISILLSTLTFSLNIHILFQHSFLLSLYSLLLQYPIWIFLYTLICYLVSFYTINSVLNTLTKKDIQLTFISLQGACVIILLNSTASVLVAFCLLLCLTLLGFITQKLKMSNLMREWKMIKQIISPSSLQSVSLDLLNIETIRQELSTLRILLRQNPSFTSQIKPEYMREYALFINLDTIIIPSSSFLSYIKSVISTSSWKQSFSTIPQTIESDTILLDETDDNRPFFPSQPAFSIASIKNHLQQLAPLNQTQPPNMNDYPTPNYYNYSNQPMNYNLPPQNNYDYPNQPMNYDLPPQRPFNPTPDYPNNPLDNTYYQAFGPQNNNLRYRNM